MVEGKHYESSIVRPSAKHDLPKPPATILLHGLDRAPPIHIEIRHFFRISHGSSIIDVINNLKDSLAEALEFYLPVAGTVITDESEENFIVTDAAHLQGALFMVDIKEEAFEKETEELSPRTGAFLPPGSPTFAVKITHFSCGTVILAGSMHHQVSDLGGYLDFVELWAQIARREAIDRRKIPTDWKRNPLRYFEELYTPKGVPKPPPGYTVLPNPLTELPIFEPSAITYWRVTKGNVEKLKNELSPTNGWVSSGDALASLCWGAITRARKEGGIARSPLSEAENERLAMAADGRQRAPGGNMSKAYFGNFNVLITLPALRSDLLLPTPEAASRVALCVRNSIAEQLTPGEIAHKVAFYEAPENAKPAGRIIWFGDVIMTNWCKFDLASSKLEMGNGIGKPSHATAGGDVYPPGYVRMLQEKASGDVIMLMTVEAPAAEYLQSDPLLQRYGSLV